MVRVVGYREVCNWAGLETMKRDRDWYRRGAEEAAGYAGRVLVANGQGSAEIDVPDDPSWLLPL
jgi:hypothetical protein